MGTEFLSPEQSVRNVAVTLGAILDGPEGQYRKDAMRKGTQLLNRLIDQILESPDPRRTLRVLGGNDES